MLWNGHNLAPTSPIMKGAPHQHHWDPAVGDRLSAWEHVGPGGALDGNLTPACHELWFLHWGVPGKDGYHRVVDAHTGHVRAMTRTELRRPAERWGREGIKRWRDAHGQAPMTAEEGIKWLVEHHVLGALEVKGPRWAREAWCFARLALICVKYGHPMWVKRIATLRFPRFTVRMAHAHHIKIAAIYGKGVRGRGRRLRATARIQRRWGRDRFDATW